MFINCISHMQHEKKEKFHKILEFTSLSSGRLKRKYATMKTV